MAYPTAQDEELRARLNEQLERTGGDRSILIQLAVLEWDPFYDMERAHELLKEVTTKNPDNAEGWFWLATFYFQGMCDVEKAREALDRALELEPNRADCLSLLWGVLEQSDVPPEQRLWCAERAVEREPEWPSLRDLLAAAYKELGRTHEAIEQAEAGLKISIQTLPEDADPATKYYEYVVTGRASDGIRDLLRTMLNSLR